MSVFFTKTPEVFPVSVTFDMQQQQLVFNKDFTFSDVVSAIDAHSPVYLVISFTNPEEELTMLGVPGNKAVLGVYALGDDECVFSNFAVVFRVHMNSNNEMTLGD